MSRPDCGTNPNCNSIACPTCYEPGERFGPKLNMVPFSTLKVGEFCFDYGRSGMWMVKVDDTTGRWTKDLQLGCVGPAELVHYPVWGRL